MNSIKRRHFLQLAGSTLATVGISQLDIMRQGDRYSRALAQEGGRKLALLVGINDYPFGDKLSGCLTDVDLQKNLLIYRFGFQEKDIRILKDKEATRQGILTAFEEHLINQAKPGDIVVFHFSGHGSQIYDADCDSKNDNGKCVNSTFIPFDNNLSFAERAKGGVVNDIMGHTLFLLMYALNTENVTVVLDSCHSGGGKRGNLIVRAMTGGEQLKPSQAEIEYQQQWLRQLNLTPEEYKKKRKEGVPKGVVIASAKREQYATDACFTGFNAGAFTYAMTQYLWQQPGNEPLSSAIVNISRNASEIANNNRIAQEPEWEDKPGSNVSARPIYFLNKTTLPAEAVVTQVQGDTANLWLGGINSQSLKAFDQKGATFSVIDSRGQAVGELKLEPESRQKLEAQGKLLKGKAAKILQPGTLLQEKMRPIPKDINLEIGLDPSLGNDKNKAERALQAIKNIQVVPMQQGKEVAYIFGRITNDNQKFQKQSNADLPPVGSIGLFTPALELIPGSFGATDETVDAAVTRLKAKFKSLIAARLVKTILNTGSSRLNVTASMSRADSNCQTYASVYTIRGSRQGTGAPEVACNSQSSSSLVSSLKLPLGTPVKFEITNREDRNLYMSVLVIDPEGEITVVFPNKWAAIEDASLVEAGETREIPQKGTDKFQFLVAKPLGMVEVLVIASSKQLKETLLALRSIAARGDRSPGPVGLRGNEPTEITRRLIQDLESEFDNADNSLPDEVAGADTSQLAAMSITFEAIE